MSVSERDRRVMRRFVIGFAVVEAVGMALVILLR